MKWPTSKAAFAVGSSKSHSNSNQNTRKLTAPPAHALSRPSQQARKRANCGDGKQPGKKQTWGRFYLNFTGFPFPLGPLLLRRTIRYTVDPGSVWCFEQEQSLGFSNVTTNIRMTVVKLQSGCLWVHAPIAPTRECVALVRELGCPVAHIVLPTFAYEHKIFVGPFSRAFPRAAVHVAPRQWSLPVSLPVQFFGIFPASVLRDNDATTPWGDEIEQKVFASSVGAGPYTEVAFYLKRSRTLLVTDAVIHIPPVAPEVVRKANLLNAGGSLPGPVLALASGGESEPAARAANAATLKGRDAVLQRGWQRMVLQILYFVPGDLLRPSAGFNAVAGRLLVSPVLQKLVFGNAPDEARRWVDEIARDWGAFTRVIPAHFSGPVPARPADLRAAFAFVYGSEDRSAAGTSTGRGAGGGWRRVAAALGAPRSAMERSLPPTDMRTLDGLASFLRKVGALE